MLYDLIIVNNETGEEISRGKDLMHHSLQIHRGSWVLYYTYFDKGIEQEIRDAETICDSKIPVSLQIRGVTE